MKNSRKLIAILLVVVMSLAFMAACGPKDSVTTSPGPAAPGTSAPSAAPSAPQPSTDNIVQEAPVEGANLADHIDLILEQALPIINPFVLAGAGGAQQKTNFLIFDRLLEQPEPGVVGPQLAYDWETDDFKTFRFYLRDDVYYHNGDHFTAEDIVWNI